VGKEVWEASVTREEGMKRKVYAIYKDDELVHIELCRDEDECWFNFDDTKSEGQLRQEGYRMYEVDHLEFALKEV